MWFGSARRCQSNEIPRLRLRKYHHNCNRGGHMQLCPMYDSSWENGDENFNTQTRASIMLNGHCRMTCFSDKGPYIYLLAFFGAAALATTLALLKLPHTFPSSPHALLCSAPGWCHCQRAAFLHFERTCKATCGSWNLWQNITSFKNNSPPSVGVTTQAYLHHICSEEGAKACLTDAELSTHQHLGVDVESQQLRLHWIRKARWSSHCQNCDRCLQRLLCCVDLIILGLDVDVKLKKLSSAHCAHPQCRCISLEQFTVVRLSLKNKKAFSNAEISKTIEWLLVSYETLCTCFSCDFKLIRSQTG